MNFESKYGYKLYSINDPQMSSFKNALDYLDIDFHHRGSYWLGIKRALVDTDHIDDGSWKHMSFEELNKLTNRGKSITIIVIAQMLDRGEISL